ncbi:MAG: hypothetical protein K6C36_05415 [Clostridia bacterium]|nr:hypothetical protein [Clostridia bacterium]
MKRIISAALAFVLLLAPVFAPVSSAAAPTDADRLLSDFVSALCGGSDNAAVEAYLGSISADAGTTPTDWFFITLRSLRPGIVCPGYASALGSFDASSENAVYRQRVALAQVYAGDPSGTAAVVNETAGQLGVMSNIWALILADSCLATGVDRRQIVSDILGAALPTGGWALFGSGADVDVTSMALTALSPYAGLDAGVKSAVDTTLGMLSARQNADGSFSSMGAANCESTAQVLMALSSLGIDALKDARFIKNKNTVVSAIAAYSDGTGLFCHTAGGGTDQNASAQAFYALCAYRMLETGEGRFFEPYGAPTEDILNGTESDASFLRACGRLYRLIIRMIAALTF